MGPDPRQDVTIPAAQMATGSDTTQTEPNAMPHLPRLSPNVLEEAKTFFRQRAVANRPRPKPPLIKTSKVGHPD